MTGPLTMLLNQPSTPSLPRLILPHAPYSPAMPEILLAGGAIVILAFASLVGRRVSTYFWAACAVAGSLAAMGWTWVVLWPQVMAHGGYTTLSGSISVDGFSLLFFTLVEASVALGALVAAAWLDRERMAGPELYVLAMLSGSGAMFMAAANDLIVIFLGLEILSIPLYILAGLNARRSESGEAAMKYFILGAFSSAIFIYGVALTYGATGTTNLAHIAAFLASNVVTTNGLLLAGLALLFVGFSFKVAAVPFHTWTPDVYQGAPSPVTGFMAAVAKAGGFAAFLRVFFSTFSTLRADWQPAIWLLAVLTLVVGAVLAVIQTDIKRMMAYSSISHAGFVLVGLYAATARGIAGSLYYLFTYALIIIGTFAVITVIGGRGDGNHHIENYRGLARRRPALAISLAVLLMAQAGVPFTTGFLGKLYVIGAVIQQHRYALGFIAMVSAVVAAFFYLRVVVVMYTPRVPAGAGHLQLAVSSVPFGQGSRDVARASNGGQAGDGAEAEIAGPQRAGALAAVQASGSGAGPARGAGGARGQGVLGEAERTSGPGQAGPLPAGAPVGEERAPRVPLAVAMVLVVTVAFTVGFGFFPALVVNFAHHASLLF